MPTSMRSSRLVSSRVGSRLGGGHPKEPAAAHAAVGDGAGFGGHQRAPEAHDDAPARGARPARVRAVRQPRPRRRALLQPPPPILLHHQRAFVLASPVCWKFVGCPAACATSTTSSSRCLRVVEHAGVTWTVRTCALYTEKEDERTTVRSPSVCCFS